MVEIPLSWESAANNQTTVAEAQMTLERGLFQGISDDYVKSLSQNYV